MTEQTTTRTETESKLKNIVITTPEAEVIITRNIMKHTSITNGVRGMSSLETIPSDERFMVRIEETIAQANYLTMLAGKYGRTYDVSVKVNDPKYFGQ